MTWDEKEERYTLSTGNSFYANRGILGINPSEPDCVSEGYDGGVGGKADYTVEERREIAETMIKAWQEWSR